MANWTRDDFRFKFDGDKAYDHSVEDHRSTNFLVPTWPKTFAKKILKARTLVIEMSVFDSGLQDVTFDVGGLTLPDFGPSEVEEATARAAPPARFGILASATKSGLVVVAVEAGSVAEKSGVRLGDAVLAIDGLPVQTPLDMTSAGIRHLPGTAMRLEIRRGGKPLEISATY